MSLITIILGLPLKSSTWVGAGACPTSNPAPAVKLAKTAVNCEPRLPIAIALHLVNTLFTFQTEAKKESF
jgi:hypothetical protein